MKRSSSIWWQYLKWYLKKQKVTLLGPFWPLLIYCMCDVWWSKTVNTWWLWEKHWRWSQVAPPRCMIVQIYFLHSLVQFIPNQLSWIQIGWLWRPGHPMQHSILPWQITLTWTRRVWGHCSVGKWQTRWDECRCKMLWQPCWSSVPPISTISSTVLPAKPPTSSLLLLHASQWEPHIRSFKPFTLSTSMARKLLGIPLLFNVCFIFAFILVFIIFM